MPLLTSPSVPLQHPLHQTPIKPLPQLDPLQLPTMPPRLLGPHHLRGCLKRSFCPWRWDLAGLEARYAIRIGSRQLWIQRLALYPGEGPFAGVNKSWIGSGTGITEKIAGYVALECSAKAGVINPAPQDLRGLCPALPSGKRRTPAYPSPARSRKRADEGKIPWVQTNAEKRCERLPRH